jgi:peroxiredoxin Q/BCP
MSQLKLDDLAPLFSLQDQNEAVINLKDFRGKKNVLVYFYPKASTPGCTTQACGIRDFKKEFEALDTEVLAISPDAPKAIAKFVEKQGLNFTLLSDPEHKTAEAYGVWALKKFMGREFMGIVRTSFLVDKAGVIKYISDKVNTKTHHQDMLDVITKVT